MRKHWRTRLTKSGGIFSKKVEEIRQAKIYGVRPTRLWRIAATRYLEEHRFQSSIVNNAIYLRQLDPFIGDLPLSQVHMGTLKPYIDARRKEGRKTKTINLALGVVRHILNLAADEWIDESGLSWLDRAQKIKLFPVHDATPAYPLSWDEQQRLIKQLPAHLQRMTLFNVNTGTREQEVCNLRWNWEVYVPEMKISVFLIPREAVKNREERLVVLNEVARSVVEKVRGQHPEYVFTYRGKPVTKMRNSAWKRAWKAAGLPTDGSYLKGVHNLKHTFGRRLRAAGVPLETRKVLLGHTNGDITTHYSSVELDELLEAANRVCGENSRKSPALVILKRRKG